MSIFYNFLSDLLRSPLIGLAVGVVLVLIFHLGLGFYGCIYLVLEPGLLGGLLIGGACILIGYFVVLGAQDRFTILLRLVTPSKIRSFIFRGTVLDALQSKDTGDTTAGDFVGCLYSMLLIYPLILSGAFLGGYLCHQGFLMVFENTCMNISNL